MLSAPSRAESGGQLIGEASVTRNGTTTVQPFRVKVIDSGEPGRRDYCELDVGGTIIAAGNLEGGNLQAHRPCKNVS